MRLYARLHVQLTVTFFTLDFNRFVELVRVFSSSSVPYFHASEVEIPTRGFRRRSLFGSNG